MCERWHVEESDQKLVLWYCLCARIVLVSWGLLNVLLKTCITIPSTI